MMPAQEAARRRLVLCYAAALCSDDMAGAPVLRMLPLQSRAFKERLIGVMQLKAGFCGLQIAVKMRVDAKTDAAGSDIHVRYTQTCAGRNRQTRNRASCRRR